MADSWGSTPDFLDAPARVAAAVVPSDTADLALIPKALWIAGAGTLSIIGAGDTGTTGVAMGSLAVGTVVPVRARRVLATGTSATVVALY